MFDREEHEPVRVLHEQRLGRKVLVGARELALLHLRRALGHEEGLAHGRVVRGLGPRRRRRRALGLERGRGHHIRDILDAGLEGGHFLRCGVCGGWRSDEVARGGDVRRCVWRPGAVEFVAGAPALQESGACGPFKPTSASDRLAGPAERPACG